MQLFDIFSEAYRNLASRTSRPLLWLLVLFISTAPFSALEYLETNQAVSNSNEYRNRLGAASRIISTENILGNRCDSLGGVLSITKAGAVKQHKPELEARLGKLANEPVPTFTATQGWFSFVGLTQPLPEGVVLSEELAVHLGVKTGEEIIVNGTLVKVAGSYRYPDDGRLSDFSYALVIPGDHHPGIVQPRRDVFDPTETIWEVELASLTQEVLNRLNGFAGVWVFRIKGDIGLGDRDRGADLSPDPGEQDHGTHGGQIAQIIQIALPDTVFVVVDCKIRHVLRRHIHHTRVTVLECPSDQDPRELIEATDLHLHGTMETSAGTL